LCKICKKFVFQFEKGEKTGYEHIQARISLHKKTTKQTLLDLFCKVFECGYEEAPSHISITSSGVHERRNFNYVMKEQTKIAGPWSDKDFVGKEEVYIPKQYRGKMESMKPFQKSISERVKEFNDRFIDLLFDPIGGRGKSVIIALMQLYNNAVKVPSFHRSPLDIMQFVANLLGEKKESITLFADLPRAMDKKEMGSFYSCLEEMKSGYFYDTRYHGKGFFVDSLNIWVSTNHLPDFSYMSLDRWRIWEINDKDELIGPFSCKTYMAPKKILKISDEPDEEFSDDEEQDIISRAVESALLQFQQAAPQALGAVAPSSETITAQPCNPLNGSVKSFQSMKRLLKPKK